MSYLQESSEDFPSDTILDTSNYYQILGVDSNATDAEISTAFDKLKLKFQLDESLGTDSSEQLKKIQEAYDILSNKDLKAQYDNSNGTLKISPTKDGNKDNTEFSEVLNSNETKPNPEVTPTDSSPKITSTIISTGENTLNSIKSAFTNVISRFNTNYNESSIPPELLEETESIIKTGVLKEGAGAPSDLRVNDLPWGWMIEGKLDKSNNYTNFYRLIVSQQQINTGFFISIQGSSRSHFKGYIFDSNGKLLMESTNQRDKLKNISMANLYFTNFDTYSLNQKSNFEPNTSEEISTSEEAASSSPSVTTTSNDIPTLFTTLGGLHPSRIVPEIGSYLLVVHTKPSPLSFKTNLKLICVPSPVPSAASASASAATAASLENINGIIKHDKNLVELKDKLDSMKDEFIKARDAYQRILDEMRETKAILDSELSNRDKSYSSFIHYFTNLYWPSEPEESESTSSTHNVGEAAVAQLSFLATNAAQTASAASGWFKSKLSSIQSIVKPREDASSSPNQAQNPSVSSPSTSSAPAPSNNEVPKEGENSSDF